MAGFEQNYTLVFTDRDISIDVTDPPTVMPHPAATVNITADGDAAGNERTYHGQDELEVTLRLNEQDQVHLVPDSLSWPQGQRLLGDKALHLHHAYTGRLLSVA